MAKYNTEEAVKKVLDIEDFKTITRKKAKELAKIAVDVKDDVMAGIINKMPDSTVLCVKMVDAFTLMGNNLLKENKELHEKVVEPHMIALKELKKKQSVRELTDDEVLQLIEIGKDLQKEAKDFRATLIKLFGIFSSVVVLVFGGILGINLLGKKK